jgi:hypothetical protein
MNLPARILALGLLIVGLFAGDTFAQEEPAEQDVDTFVAMFTMPKGKGKCPPCDKMKPIVKLLDSLGFPITIIDDGDLAAAVGIKSFPTFVGVVKGKIVKVRRGTMPAQVVMELLPKKFHVELPEPDKGSDAVLRARNPGAATSESRIFIFNRPRYWFQKQSPGR